MGGGNEHVEKAMKIPTNCGVQFPIQRPILTSMPALPPSSATRHGADMSVILVTGSYDHEIRFWEAWSGICSRTIARSGESGVRQHRLVLVHSESLIITSSKSIVLQSRQSKSW